jgi:hypothetical protein
MPVTYTIDANERIIRTRCTGNVTFQEVIDHFHVLGQDPNCPDQLDVLLDLSEATSTPNSSQISAVANQVKMIQNKVRFGFCAIIASRDALFGMLRMFEVMTQQCFRASSVFRVAAEAEAWLASERSLVG